MTIGEKLKIVLIKEATTNHTINHGKILAIDISACASLFLFLSFYVKIILLG